MNVAYRNVLSIFQQSRVITFESLQSWCMTKIMTFFNKKWRFLFLGKELNPGWHILLKWVTFLCAGYQDWPGHGLQTPNEAFFHGNPKVLSLGRQFGQINFWTFGVFSVNLSAPILVLWVPCPCFPLIKHYFYKKLSLYIQIPNIYLGSGFEFGLQRDLAIVCP